jgi:hypothetical protein
MGSFMAHRGRLWFLIKACEMNECEAPESKITVVEIELTLNVPNMTSGYSCVVLADTWFTLPVFGGG